MIAAIARMFGRGQPLAPNAPRLLTVRVTSPVQGAIDDCRILPGDKVIVMDKDGKREALVLAWSDDGSELHVHMGCHEPEPQRYRMYFDARQHELSGAFGQAVVVARPDPAGEWVRAPQ